MNLNQTQQTHKTPVHTNGGITGLRPTTNHLHNEGNPRMSNRTNFVSIENWVTIGVAPLPPGWVNVYKSDDGGHWVYETPALLLQESTWALQGWDEPGPVGGPEFVRRSREVATDRETRVVYADSDGGCMEPANDAGNYLFSCTRTEYEMRQAEGLTR